MMSTRREWHENEQTKADAVEQPRGKCPSQSGIASHGTKAKPNYGLRGDPSDRRGRRNALRANS